MIEIKSLTLPLDVLILNFCILSVYQVGRDSIKASMRNLKNVIYNYEMELDFLFNIFLKHSSVFR